MSVTILPAAESLQGNIVGGVAPTATNAINLVRIASLSATGDNSAEGGAEVVAFDKASGKFYSQNTREGLVDIAQVNADGTITSAGSLNLKTLTDFGGVNSIAVKDGLLAVAYLSTTAGGNGHVALFDIASLSLINTITVGAGPDQLVFTPDGQKLLVANEGEAISVANNPEGGVSIIDLSGGAAAAVVSNTIGFSSLNGTEQALRDAGMQVYPGFSASKDIEPEYITISPDGTRAYVSLQEVSGIAVIDLTNPAADAPMAILPTGFIDHTLPGNAMDASDRDGPSNTAAIELINVDIRGLPQPDALAAFDVGGVTYFIAANEGDARVGSGIEGQDINRLSNSAVVLDTDSFTPAEISFLKSEYGRLNVFTKFGDTDGDGAIDQLYTLGGRGISIFRQEADGSITKVRETGGEFEAIIARDFPAIFNQNQGTGFDTRSDDKGPEPEGVTVGVVDGRVYAFAVLERTGGVMVYDVTDPANAQFVQYKPSQPGTDNGPEVVTFIRAEDSPTGTALVLSANEISGNTTVYAVSAPQEVRFDAGSLNISKAEGASGTTTYSFTVERTGGTIGDLSFSGAVSLSGATADDFAGGVIPTFSGVIAAGQNAVTISIEVAGDTVIEAEEGFTILLDTAVNSRAADGFTAAVASSQASATAVIRNDDFAKAAPIIFGDTDNTPSQIDKVSSVSTGNEKLQSGFSNGAAFTDYQQFYGGQGNDTFALRAKDFGGQESYGVSKYITDFQGAGGWFASNNDFLALTGFGAGSSLTHVKTSAGNGADTFDTYVISDGVSGAAFKLLVHSLNGERLSAGDYAFY